MAIIASISFTHLVTALVWCLAILDQSFLSVEAVNNRPIIGVLTQEVSSKLDAKYPGHHSYIAASYVKFIEGAGGRIVPIWIGQDDSYYKNITKSVNGILWPGGAASFDNSNGYADAGDKIYRIAKRINAEGTYFPILGICLGMELLTYVAANRTKHRERCASQKQHLPLHFEPDFRNSKLFDNPSPNIIEILKTENVTMNNHKLCITENDLKKVGINNQFHVLSSNLDTNGVKFISTLEHTDLPFYGLQFHPEKNIYEWVTGKNIPHGDHAIQVSQYFADFFVNEARKNNHAFPSADEEAANLIYNYPATYTGLKKSAFVQCYMFKKSDTVIKRTN